MLKEAVWGIYRGVFVRLEAQAVDRSEDIHVGVHVTLRYIHLECYLCTHTLGLIKTRINI